MLSCTICNQTSEDLHPILNGGKLRDNYYKLRNLEEKTHFISSGYREHIHPQCLIFLKYATYIQERIQNTDNTITINYIIFGIDEIHKNKTNNKAKCATCSMYIPQKMPLKCSAPGCTKVFHADCLVKYKKRIFMTDQARRREFLVYCVDHSKFLQQDYRVRLVDWQFWDQIVKETFDAKLEHTIENPRMKAQDDCIIIENEIYSDIDPKIVKLKEYLKQKGKKKTKKQAKTVKEVQKQEPVKKQVVKKVINGPQPFVQIDYSKKVTNNKAKECDSFIQIDREEEMEKQERVERIVKKCKGLLDDEEISIINQEKNKYKQKNLLEKNEQPQKPQANEKQKKQKQEQGKEEVVTQQLNNNTSCEQLIEYLENTRKKLNLPKKQDQQQDKSNIKNEHIQQQIPQLQQQQKEFSQQLQQRDSLQQKENRQTSGKKLQFKKEVSSKSQMKTQKLKRKQMKVISEDKQQDKFIQQNQNVIKKLRTDDQMKQNQNSHLSLYFDYDHNDQLVEWWDQFEKQYFCQADIKQILDGFKVDGQLYDVFRYQNCLIVLYQGLNRYYYVQYGKAKEYVQFKDQYDYDIYFNMEQEDGQQVAIPRYFGDDLLPNIHIEHICEIDQFDFELLNKSGKALHSSDPLLNVEETYERALEKIQQENQKEVSKIKVQLKNLPIPNVFVYTDKIKLMQIQKQMRRGFQKKSWESHSISQHAKYQFNPQLKEPDPFDTFCMVCFHYYKSLDSIDEVVYCVDCWATFHQKCYQFGENQQKCDTCKHRKSDQQNCQICFQEYENIPLKLIDGKLYHITCTIIFNFLYFENDEMKIKLGQNKFEAPCFICDSFKGFKVKCNSCDTYCHPLCAYIFGLNITYDDEILFICPKDDKDFTEQGYYEQVYFRQHGLNFRRCAEMKSFQDFVQNKLKIIDTYKKVIKYSK